MARRYTRFIVLPPKRIVAPTSSFDTSDKTVAIFGDSMTAQNTVTADRFEAVGYMVQLNAVTGQRYNFNHSLNFGIGGNTSAEALARLPSVIASSADIVIILLGANDRAGKQTAQWSINNMTGIVNGIRAAGKRMVIVTSIPRRDARFTDIGFTAAEIAQAKADTIELNNWIKAQEAPDLLIADAYAAMVDQDGQCFDNVTFDGLHPNILGALKIMRVVEAVLTPRYGVRQFTLSPSNKFINTSFSGAGGILNGIATGQVANNHLLAGSAPTGTASRSASKATGQALAFNFPAGGTDADNLRCYQRYTANEVGKTAYYEVELRALNSGIGTGIWRTLSAELRTSAGSLSVGYDRAGASDQMAINELNNFLTEKRRTLLLRTPAMVIPTSTYIEGRLNIEVNTTGGAKSGSIELLNEQLVVV